MRALQEVGTKRVYCSSLQVVVTSCVALSQSFAMDHISHLLETQLSVDMKQNGQRVKNTNEDKKIVVSACTRTK